MYYCPSLADKAMIFFVTFTGEETEALIKTCSKTLCNKQWRQVVGLGLLAIESELTLLTTQQPVSQGTGRWARKATLFSKPVSREDGGLAS